MKNVFLFVIFFSLAIVCGNLSLHFFEVVGLSILFLFLSMAFFLLGIGYFFGILAFVFPRKSRRICLWIKMLCFELLYIGLIFSLYPFSFFPLQFQKKSSKIPILLVHGYMNSSSVWVFHLFHLVRQGFYPIYTVSLRKPFQSIEEHGKTLEKKVEKIFQKRKEREIILIGHSMGGLVSCYYATKIAKKGEVLGVITLGSPLQGTKVAEKIGIGKSVEEMRFASPFVKDLEKSIESASHIQFFHIATQLDRLIVPYTSSLLGEDLTHQYIFEELGHAALLFSRKVNKKISSWLKMDLQG